MKKQTIKEIDELNDMRHKYLIPIAVLMILVSQITAISALDNNSDEDITKQIIDGIDSIKDSVLDNNPSDAKEVKVHGYDELKNIIEEYDNNNKNESYLILLEDGDYNITEPILYRTKDNKKQRLTIDGQGHTIDGQKKHRFMHFDNCNITLKNLIIQNTVHDDNDHAGVFEMLSPSNLNVINCTFMNNVGDKKGSVLTNRGNATITDSTFINNTANHVGGAIWSTGEYGGLLNLTNNTFEKNTANKDDNNERTAIVYCVSGGLNVIDGNAFINNTGRCIHCYNNTNANITNNEFHKNNLKDVEVIRGGIIDNYESNITIKNNIFDDDSTNGELRGGVLYHEIGYLEFINNTVTDTHIQEKVTSTAYCSKGGVIFNRNSTAVISNNKFNNKMIGNLSRGGVLYNNMANVTLENNSFENVVEGNNIQGVAAYTDVAGVINAEGNVFDSKITGTVIEDLDKDKNIYNSNQPMAESNNKRGVVNYN
ncbi:MAG: hypothetical protein BZ137_07430 [Methanosphaera sp. rholeuAM130]|nr:MAG: hypothetical protein BZ137_07430 [Methanosphaera sp. rholeuAM130]